MSIYESSNHFISITAFYALSLQEFDMHPHSHLGCEIMYVDQGHCFIHTTQEILKLHKGQFIFLDAETPHGLVITKDSPCSILNLEFRCGSTPTPLALSELCKQSDCIREFLEEKKSFFIGMDNFNLGFAMKDLIANLQKKQPDQEYLIRLLFYRTFLELSHNTSYRNNITGTQYLKKACTYIEGHLIEALSIPQIAAFTGINKSYLQSLFAKQLHCSITEYINRQRLKQAVYLLTNSSLSVTDIAFHAGYNSRQHFSSTFKKYYAQSPLSYRQLKGKPPAPSTKDSQYLYCTSGGWDKTQLK